MGRPKDEEIWNNVIKGPSNSAKCKFCNKNYKSVNITRMKSHLIKCVKCPLHVRHALKLKYKEMSPVRDPLRPITNLSQIGESSSSSILSAAVQEERIENSSDDDDTTPVLHNIVSKGQKQVIDRKLAKAIYVSGAPLSLVEQPLWKELFGELQPSYKLPSRKFLSTTLLDETYNEIEREVNERLFSASDLHLQLDGWSNIRNEGIINFLISTPEPAFVKYLHTESNHHTSEYIAKEIIEVLKKYGEEKFFVLIGDNARNMQSALKIVKNKYPYIVPLGCVAHALNLLCHDYMKCVSISSIVETATQIVKAIKSSQILSALFAKIIRENNSGQQLKLPCKTRWGSNTASLESLCRSKASLQALAVNEKCSLLRSTKDALLNEDFWTQVTETLSLLKPISKWILELESNEYNMCKVFSIFPEIEEPIISNQILSDAEKLQLIENINERKRFCVQPIHLAAHMLDPKTQGQLLSTEEEIEAMRFIGEIACSLKMDNVISELADYRSKEGQLWRHNFVWSCISQVNPVSWWKGICGSSPLSKIAVRILSAPTTSAATERSFSKFSFIHTKLRNRLTTDRAGKLTYISYNWNLMHKKQCPMTRNDCSDDLEDSDEDITEETENRVTASSEPVPSTSTANLYDFNISSDSE